MTWSYEEFEEREEPFNDVKVLVSLAATESPLANAEVNVVSFPEVVAKSSDDKEISDEEMVHSYKVMYEKLVKALSENQDLRKQVFLLSKEKENLDKQCNTLRDKVCQQEESLHELE